jgi:cell division protein FtsN
LKPFLVSLAGAIVVLVAIANADQGVPAKEPPLPPNAEDSGLKWEEVEVFLEKYRATSPGARAAFENVENISTPAKSPVVDNFAVVAEDDGVTFRLEVGVFPTREKAFALAAAMERRGLETQIFTAQSPGKGTRYSVRVGRFKSEAEASTFRKGFRLGE